MDKAFYTITPTSKDDGLVVGQYPDSESIIALAKELVAGQHSAYDSVLISHKDRLVFESYYGYGRSNLPHFQASATKTYTAMAIGRAIALGYLSMADLHKPVLSFLPDVNTENLVEGAEKVTLHHTMSMRSGLRIAEQTLDALADAAEQLKGQQLAQFYFTQSEPVIDQKQIYQYQPVDPRLTMLVLDAVVPDSAKNFIKTELLDKLGIKQYAWQDNPSGVPEGAHSTSMMSRDMLKWASVFTNQGQWQGKPFI